MRTTVFAVTLLTFSTALADTFVWTGASDAKWTNPLNWTDETGGAVSRCPGALQDADMGVTWSNWTNDVDTAVFSGAGNGNTTIDLSGLFSIQNIKVTGAETPVYTFGSSSDQNLPIRGPGTFTVDADVVNAPVFAGAIACGVGYPDDSGNQRMHKGRVDFYNDAAVPLVVSNFVRTVMNPDTKHTTSSIFYWTYPYFHSRGTGGIRITGDSPDLSTTFRFYPTFCPEAGVTTIAAPLFRPFTWTVPADGTAGEKARIEIAEGCVFATFPATTIATDYGLGLSFGDAVISGAGTYSVTEGSGWNLYGHTVTFDCAHFTVPNDGGVKLASGYDGTHVVFTDAVTNDMKGSFTLVKANDSLETPSIGGTDGPSALGFAPSVVFSVNNTKAVAQTLTYTGAGETTARSLVCAKTGANALTVNLVQKGTGAWTLAGDFENTCTNGLVLALQNEMAFPAEIASTLVDEESGGALSVVKTGAGTWRLGGASTYTGATTVSAGTFELTPSGSAESSAFSLAAGATLSCAASETAVEKTLSSLAVTGSGEAVLAVGANVTLNLTALPTVAATAVLNILAADGAVVKCPAAAGQTLPFGAIRYNGQRAAVGADGVIATGIYPITKRVDVRGGSFGSGATDIVGFNDAGDAGTVTLTETAVTVDAISQDLPDTAATVTVGAGQTLSAGILSIVPDAADLTVKAADATGAFVVPAGGLLIDNKSATGTVRVDAPLAGTGAISKYGVGAAVFGASGDWTKTFTVGEGSVSFADDGIRGVTVTADGAPGTVTYTAAGGSGTLVKPAGDASTLTLTGTAPETDTQTLEIQAGTAHVTGEDTSLRYYAINVSPTAAGETASLVIDGGAKVTAQYEVFVGPKTAKDNARGLLVVSNATFGLDYVAMPAYMHNAVFVGTGHGKGGIMRIEEGAVVSNNLIVSGNSGYHGAGAPSAVYQRGGEARIYGNGNQDYAANIGLGGYGYYEITGGMVDFCSGVSVGGSRTSSGQWGQGVLFIGPKAKAWAGELRLSRGYGSTRTIRSLVRVQGQLSQTNSYPQFNGAYNAKESEQAMGRADLVIDGADAYHENAGSSYIARTYLNGVGLGGAITLYAGTYQHFAFVRGNAPNNTAPYHLHFNGGCLRASNSAGTGVSCSNAFGLDKLDRATIYARGAIVDSNAPGRQAGTYHATLDAPLLSAPGNGVASVPLPASVADGVFVGPPFVVIEGDGDGAVAVAEFDSDTGKVTGVKVVSPGWNYTSATVRFITGVVTNGVAELSAADFAPNALGSLTKRGPGYLHATCSNEVSSVICEAGTFLAEVPGAVPATAAVVLRGGTLDMTTNVLAFASLSGTNGVLKGTVDAENKLVVTTQNPGTGLSGVSFRDAIGAAATLKQTATGAWTVDAEDLLAGKTVVEPGEFAFGPDATLTISGDVSQLDPEKKYVILEATAGTFEGLPTLTNANLTNWTLRKVGGKLVLKYSRGLMLIVR